MAKKDPRVDAYIAKAQPYAKPILKELRRRIHSACPDVVEDIKWSAPAFMYKGILANMAAFKNYAAFVFWDQMYVIDDQAKESAGQLAKLTTVADLPAAREFASLVKEAVARRDAGIKPKREKTARRGPVDIPDEFTGALKKNKKALATWEAFAPSHRREYVEWITDAKQDATRERRIATALAWLTEGKSRNWKYQRS